MDPILVPAPPRSAYNPNRRVSDLLYSQLQHFQHIEKKRGDLGIDPALASNIHTEGGAALYIAAVTRALRGTAAPTAAAPSKLAVLSTPKPAKKPVASLAIAAAAASSPPSGKKAVPKKIAKKKAAKKSPKKK